MAVRLPSEYQKVEYLESTGTQYIDTGLQFGESDFKISSRFAQTRRTTNEQPLFSIWTGVYNYWNCFIRYANQAVDLYLSEHVVPQTPVLSVDEIVDITVERNDSEWTLTQPGSILTKTYAPSKVNNVSMKIFRRGDLNTAATYARMYSLTVEMDGELAANYVPCYRKSDSEPGMYDTISGNFYTNSGTGEFLVGGDVTWDTASLLERRRQILLNTPHIESASGSMATFSTDMSAPLTECKVHFTPVQEGTGTPSPDNVRPIHGWDGVTVYNGQTAVATITFPQTIYGGYVDLVKGEVVKEWAIIEMSKYSSIQTPSGSSEPWNHRFNLKNWSNTAKTWDRISTSHVLCDCIQNGAGLGKTNYTGDDSTSNWYVYDNTISTYTQFKEKYAEHYAAYRTIQALHTTYSLTSQTIKSLKGLNNLWSNMNGNIEVKFWRH